MRCPNHCARRQRRRIRVLQKLPSRGDRADPHARLGTRRDARMASAIRQAAIVNRLVSDARPETWRRGTRAVPSSRLAGGVDRNRYLRVLAGGSHRRVPRRLTGVGLPGPSAEMPGTYQTRCTASFRSATTQPTATRQRSTTGTSSPSRTPPSCWLSGVRERASAMSSDVLVARDVDVLSWVCHRCRRRLGVVAAVCVGPRRRR